MLEPPSSNKKAVLSQGDPRDAAVGLYFDCIKFYNGIVWFPCHSMAFLLVFADNVRLCLKFPKEI